MTRPVRTLLVVALLLAGGASALCPPLQAPDGRMSGLVRRAVLGTVWRTVERDYVYRDFNGLDWDATLERYRERIEEAGDNAGFYRVVDEMILELGDDHSIYLSPWEACAEDGLHDAELDDGPGVPSPTAVRLGEHPDIVYLSLPSFDSLDVPAVVDDLLSAQLLQGEIGGLVLDLRHNYGGYLASAYRVLGNFLVGHLGTEVAGGERYPVQVRPGPHYRSLRDVRLMVLVDDQTVSAAEIVAGALQQRRQAIVVGTTTMGNTELISPFDLLDGSRLWLAVAGFELPDGSTLEGRGVVPDAPLPFGGATAGGDPALDRAVAILLADRAAGSDPAAAPAPRPARPGPPGAALPGGAPGAGPSAGSPRG